MITILLPCYNAINGWEKIIETHLPLIRNSVSSFELIIINDGSTKNFVEENVKSVFSHHPEVKIISYSQNRGKGFALREGAKVSAGDLIIFTDIDFPYTHESFRKIYSALKEDKADVAIGIRSEEYYTHLPKTRTRISKLLRFFITRFLRIPTDDTQCGLKGFNQKGKEVFLQTKINRYLFDLEFIFLSARKKLSLKMVEVELRPEVHLSTMNWKILLQEFGNFLKLFIQSIF